MKKNLPKFFAIRAQLYTHVQKAEALHEGFSMNPYDAAMQTISAEPREALPAYWP